MFTHMDLHTDVPGSSAAAASITSPNCTLDLVRVRDGDDPDAPLIGTYCLSRVPPPITSQVGFHNFQPPNSVFITFVLGVISLRSHGEPRRTWRRIQGDIFSPIAV